MGRLLHPLTVYTFLADVDEVLTGWRREGIYAGAATFAGNQITRLVIVFAWAACQQFGFPSGSQPNTAVAAITGIFVFGVIGLALGAIYFSMQMKLDRQELCGAAGGNVFALAMAVASKMCRLRPGKDADPPTGLYE